MDRVYIYKDDNNAIALFRDSFKGISVQLIRFVNQMQPTGEDGELVAHRREVGIAKYDVLSTDNGVRLSPEKFKAKVSDAIAKAQQELNKVQEGDTMIDGVMNDYLSQNRKANG